MAWPTTKTDHYLDAANKLNASAVVGSLVDEDYAKIIDLLLPAVKEQRLVFNRLRLEILTKNFSWNQLGFVSNPTPLLGNAGRALSAGESWVLNGRPLSSASAVFTVLSQSFMNLLDSSGLIRKELGWHGPHMGPPDGGPTPYIGDDDSPRTPVGVS